jgi:hypothetical protein
MQHVAEPVGEFKHYVEDADTACRKARMDRHRRWFRKYMTWLYAQDDKLPSDKQPEVFGAALRVKYQMHSDITFMELYKLSHRLARKPRERRLAGKPWRTPAEVEAIHENVASATELLTAQVWHGVFGIHCLLVFACVLDEMLRTLKRCVDLGSRDVANRVGLSRRTVSSCLRALCGLRVRQQTPVPVVLLRQARNCADDDVDVTHAFGYQLRPDVETVEKGFFAGARYHLPLRFNLDCSCGSLIASLGLWAFHPAGSLLSWLGGLHCPSTPPCHHPPIVEDLLNIMDHAVEHPLNVHFDLSP